MSLQPDFQFANAVFYGCKPIFFQIASQQMSSDGGLLLFGELDHTLGWTPRFAQQITDTRQTEKVEHTILEMVRSRVFGVLAGYADQNDHDALRSDPVFKLIAGRSLHDDPLASQPTLSRFENMVDVASLRRLEQLFLELFIESFEESPKHITLDLDTFDDPAHGDQQLVLFHAFYGQYQYQPRLITCAENDQIVAIQLLNGAAHAATGADEDLTTVIRRLREAFPGVRIDVRGDSGFGVPQMYQACEREEVFYSFGLGMNSVLRRFSDPLLEEAQAAYEETGEFQRRFCAFWYRAGSWPAQRWVIVKVEVNDQGTNRRAIVTNRPGAFVLFGATYDAYADRGESENRNKEFKVGLEADRLSDHRYMANLFRLFLHGLSYNLLNTLRHRIALPVEESSEIPSEALSGRARKRHQNRRRERDPLGEGQPCTWRTRLIKVACRIRETSRRVVVELSQSWPYLAHYRAVLFHLHAPPAGVCGSPG